MPERVFDLGAMIAGMEPVLDAVRWQFTLVEGEPPTDAFALIREGEGTTAIIPHPGPETGTETDARAPAFARITLMVHSALEGVGLTAAVSAALAQRGIACNVIAGFHHDHLFVPWDRRSEALAVLEALSRQVQ